MPSAGEAEPISSPPSVFLSYASEDRTAARSIRDALAAAGLEVWYDESELGGGEEWDQKIRRQIRECDFFMPVISAQTQARHEGYFRREWRLAVDRTLDMADGHVFLLPVVIDGTEQAAARVPDRFTTVQWLKVPGGRVNPALTALGARLVCGRDPEPLAPKRAGLKKAAASGQPAPALPEFPVEEPGQRVKFWVHVGGWAARSSWILFKRLPRWARAIACLWLIGFLLSHGCSEKHEAGGRLSPDVAAKLKAISAGYKGSTNNADIGKLGTDIARAFTSEAGDAASGPSPLLAVPFTAPANSPEQSKFADSTFASLYGRLAISHQNKVGLSKEPLAPLDIPAAVERGRASGAKYVLCGGIEGSGAAANLTVSIVGVADGAVVWSKSYPAAGSDGAAVAAEIESHVPALEDD